MQTWITDINFRKSAENLDVKRLGAQIYEGIHILSSLTGLNDKLVNPKRNVSNHPAALLWKGYEQDLMNYLKAHLDEWYYRKYNSFINLNNLKIIIREAQIYPMVYQFRTRWITDELIETHRSVLIQKKPEFYSQKWPNVPTNKTMHYNWREIL